MPAVTNALKQLTTVDVSQLIVNRQFKTKQLSMILLVFTSGSSLFGVRKTCYNRWRGHGMVGVQTAWKLEPAYMYDDKDTTTKQPDQNEDSAVRVDLIVSQILCVPGIVSYSR